MNQGVKPTVEGQSGRSQRGAEKRGDQGVTGGSANRSSPAQASGGRSPESRSTTTVEPARKTLGELKTSEKRAARLPAPVPGQRRVTGGTANGALAQISGEEGLQEVNRATTRPGRVGERWSFHGGLGKGWSGVEEAENGYGINLQGREEVSRSLAELEKTGEGETGPDLGGAQLVAAMQVGSGGEQANHVTKAHLSEAEREEGVAE